MSKKATPVSRALIPSSEILSHIGKIAQARQEHVSHAHQVAISCFAIAAKDGQISPLNRLAIVLTAPDQFALKSYALEHCRTWLTMEKNAYKVKTDTEDQRHAFLQEAPSLLEGNFLARPERAPSAPKPLTEPKILTAVSGILKKVEKAVAAGSPLIHDDVAHLLQMLRDRLARMVEAHNRPLRGRGRPRKEAVVQLPPARRGRPRKILPAAKTSETKPSRRTRAKKTG